MKAISINAYEIENDYGEIMVFMTPKEFDFINKQNDLKDKEIERLNKVLKYLELYFSNREDYELAQLVRDIKQANIEWLDKAIGGDKE